MTTAEGMRRRTAGIEEALAADAAVHRNVSAWVRWAVQLHAAAGGQFTADDVRSCLPGPVLEHAGHNVMPGVFSNLARAGVIRRAGFTRSTRSSRHGAILTVWEGQ